MFSRIHDRLSNTFFKHYIWILLFFFSFILRKFHVKRGLFDTDVENTVPLSWRSSVTTQITTHSQIFMCFVAVFELLHHNFDQTQFVSLIPLPPPQHLSYGNGSLHVDAAFQQTLWSVAPICSGSEVGQGRPVCQSLFSLYPY